MIVLLAVGVSACGFRLAGTAALPEQLSSIQLLTRDFSAPQRESLQQRLRRAGATLVDDNESGVPRLTVTLVVVPDRDLVTSASTGKTIRRISRGLDFSLASPEGDILVRKSLRQQRDFTRGEDNLLASDRELAEVVDDLEQALFNLLIQQLKRI